MKAVISQLAKGLKAQLKDIKAAGPKPVKVANINFTPADLQAALNPNVIPEMVNTVGSNHEMLVNSNSYQTIPKLHPSKAVKGFNKAYFVV